MEVAGFLVVNKNIELSAFNMKLVLIYIYISIHPFPPFPEQKVVPRPESDPRAPRVTGPNIPSAQHRIIVSDKPSSLWSSIAATPSMHGGRLPHRIEVRSRQSDSVTLTP